MRASRGLGAMRPGKLKGLKSKNPAFAGGGKNFIAGAIKKPGALRAQLKAKPGEPIPEKKLAKAAKAPGQLGQRARLAETLRKMKK